MRCPRSNSIVKRIVSDEQKEQLEPSVEIIDADEAQELFDEFDGELLPKEISLPEAKGKKSSSKDLVPFDPLERYLAEIRHYPVLSREDEKKLAIRYKEGGDQAAGYKLVMANLKLVVMIAREYRRNFKNILDLIQEGNIGLLEAVEKFDPYAGVRFPSYAVYWIRAFMLRYLINNIRLVKVGTTQAQRKLFFNLKKEKARLEREGFAPEAKLLAERLDVKESEVLEMEQRLALPDLSLDAPLVQGEERGDYHSILSSTHATADELVEENDFSQKITAALQVFKKDLNDKEIALLERRLFSEETATLQEIAEDFGITRERMRQIEARLKEKLKVYLKEKLDLDQRSIDFVDKD